MDLVTVPRIPVFPADRLVPAEPFTPQMAAGYGLGRSVLERLVRQGVVRRLFRGVYVSAAVVDTRSLRARALALRVGDRPVVVGGRTAAWVYGALTPRDEVPWEIAGARGVPLPAADDVVVVGGVRCTSPVRTATDLARSVAEEHALPVLDALLRTRMVSHAALLSASAGARHGPGVRQLRRVTALADGRALDAAESLLRLGWYGSRLPTPVPGARVAGARLSLGLRAQGFGVVVGSAAAEDRARWASAGWCVLELDGRRVLGSASDILAGYLEREYHQHLLRRHEG